jgi:3-hydroxyisobutyrate dehydrogenase-like beta-hydroxyacid dehydrogenase
MAIQTVAVMSPGDMGHSVGNVLRHGGLRVITCLRSRSPRTAALAAEAGIADVPDYETLVREADVLLSVLAPAQARALADRVAAAVRATGADLTFVECNAIAPQTVREIAEVVTAAGARCVDAGIIGNPPEPNDARNKVYVSGEHAAEVVPLGQHGLNIRPIGPKIGQASGLKMCYAALTKGLNALGTELLTAAAALDLSDALRAELQASQPNILQWLERQIPGMPPKAYRWVGEMEEIAATFGYVGLTPLILQGAADLFRFVEQTPLGEETPEVRTRGTTVEDVVAVLAEALESRGTVASGQPR